MGSLRLFVAIEIPPEIRNSIADLLAPMRSGQSPVKWERTEKLHVTLRFLGDTAEEAVPAITSALRRAALDVPKPSAVRYTSTGFFPNRHHPKILWIGMDDPAGLATRLHDSIEREIRSLGIEGDDKKFHPHVTVGRIRHERPSSSLLDEFERRTLHTDPVQVDQFVLMKSILTSDTSLYSVVERFAIGGKEEERTKTANRD